MSLKISLFQKLYYSLCLLIAIVVLNDAHGKSTRNESSQNWEYVSNEIKEICRSVKNISSSPQWLPNDTDKETLKNCDSDDLYFGFENPPDYIKARKCALLNNHYDVLTMIYANGKGVRPDLNLALHYACIMDAAPAEMEDRINHLYKIKKINQSKKSFNICDDITSGSMMGLCADLDRRSKKAQQNKYIGEIRTKWPSVVQESFQKLQNASKTYFEARTENEIERSGTGATAFEILENMALNKRMIDLLNKTIKCKLPAYTTKQYQVADNQLNIVYKKAHNNKFSGYVGITKSGIKKTEKAWIKYKDSWVYFGHIKCPNISAESWKTIITKERIKELEELANL